MNRIKYKLLLMPYFFLAAACSSKDIDASSLEKEILGTWDCSYSLIEEDGTGMNLTAKETYKKNGLSSSVGLLKAKFSPDLPEIQYHISALSTWELKDGLLLSTLNDVKVTNLNHPELDKIINLKEMMPLNITDPSEIIEISPSKMILRSEDDDGLYKCEKAS